MDFYFQDDWKLTPRLTVNLGGRYDLAINSFNQTIIGNNRPTRFSTKSLQSQEAMNPSPLIHRERRPTTSRRALGLRGTLKVMAKPLSGPAVACTGTNS